MICVQKCTTGRVQFQFVQYKLRGIMEEAVRVLKEQRGKILLLRNEKSREERSDYAPDCAERSEYCPRAAQELADCTGKTSTKRIEIDADADATRSDATRDARGEERRGEQ